MLLATREYRFELGDAVVAVKYDRGRVKPNQLFQPVAQGAVSGMLWGSLIGLLFMVPLAGCCGWFCFQRTQRATGRSWHPRRLYETGAENTAIR